MTTLLDAIREGYRKINRRDLAAVQEDIRNAQARLILLWLEQDELNRLAAELEPVAADLREPDFSDRAERPRWRDQGFDFM